MLAQEAEQEILTRCLHTAQHTTQSSGSDSNPNCQRLLVPADSPGGEEKQLRKLVETDEDLAQLLVKLQDHHWRIRKAELAVCVHPDGSDYVLAKGAFAKVFRGVLNNSLTVAIKSVSDPKMSSRVAFLAEIVCLMNLRHANIVQFYGAVIEDKTLLLVTEYMPRGSLYDVMANDMDGRLQWYRRGQQVAMSVVRALVYMHARGAVHQDLKSKNVLIGKDWTAKLCDVGLVCWPRVRHDTASIPGTLEYTAPEVLSGSCSRVSKSSDIYSLGVLLWEIASGNPPEHRRFELKCPECCPQEVRNLIQACLQINPQSRPTIDKVFRVICERHPPPTRPLEARQL